MALPPITMDMAYLAPEVTGAQLHARQYLVETAHRRLYEGTGEGADYLGWRQPERDMPEETLTAVTACASALRDEIDTLVVVGIGGSYLGARAVIDALTPSGGPEVLYLGQTLSAAYTQSVLEHLRNRRFAINVISKSGSTTEPAVAFRLVRALLEERVGADAARRMIVATTDPQKGALRSMAGQEGWKTFVIPADVGGRYSVFTACGLLPIAVAGVDVRELLAGAIDAAAACRKTVSVDRNPAAAYALTRQLLMAQGYSIELLASFEPALRMVAEWWKQLFGESEGKEHTGLFPASVEYTTDLHSMGQYVQEGRRMLFETFLLADGGQPEVVVPADAQNKDGLNFLAGLGVDAVNRRACDGTRLAHRDGGVPNLGLHLPELNAYNLGGLLAMFMHACGYSGYMQGVNPFNQPGVEAYKQNMFALMGKPGYEAHTAEVTARIARAAEAPTIAFG